MRYNIIIILLGLLLSCKTKEGNSEIMEIAEVQDNKVTLTENQSKNANIQTTLISDSIIKNHITCTGYLDVPNVSKMIISSNMDGIVKQLNLQLGSKITKGQIIATIENKELIDLQHDYLLTSSKLDLASKELARQELLIKGNASSDKIYQQTLSEVSSLNISLSMYEEKLKIVGINPKSITTSNIKKSITIYSPLNGYISAISAKPGQFINSTTELCKIIDPTKIIAVLKVYERNVTQLKSGQNVEFFLNSDKQKKYIGKINLIQKEMNTEGTIDVLCDIQNKDNLLLPGSFINGKIEAKLDKANLLPSESIVSYEGKDYVLIELDKNKYEIMEVNTGREQDGFIEIYDSSNFKEKRIVTDGAYTLLMMLKNKE